MVSVEVVGVRVDRPHNAPVLLLRESTGDRHVPIWIAATEASAIVSALEGEEPRRPMTHDLMMSTLESLGHSVDGVTITQVDDGVFFAELQVDSTTIECRPSDGIALAVRCGAPISCAEEVIDKVGVRLTSQDEEVKRFREFLESVNPEDFDT